MFAFTKSMWKEADEYYTKALHYTPKDVRCYVNRAHVRLRNNNLRGAMSDYDTALELDPNNFLAHYNRGLLRQQVGDDNRAIEDFNYVLSLEPGNIMALFNRAILEDRTGDLRSAIRDYSIVIKKFPNFWTGLKFRAECYRRLGQTANAEKDEYRILKAQMDKHLGVQNRWSSAKLQQMRKLSDIDLEKYDQIVVEDDASQEPEYKSEYRGKIQNRQITEHYQPYIVMQRDSLVEKTEYVEVKVPKTAQDFYNLGTHQARDSVYAEAIENLTKAIEIDPYFSHAYYNRGLAYLHSNEIEKSQADLSKAGELGLYSAYSLMKQNNKKNKKK